MAFYLDLVKPGESTPVRHLLQDGTYFIGRGPSCKINFFANAFFIKQSEIGAVFLPLLYIGESNDFDVFGLYLCLSLIKPPIYKCNENGKRLHIFAKNFFKRF